MAKKRSFYHSLKNLTSVPLRDLKPIQVETGKRRVEMPLRRRVVLVVLLCVALMLLTIVLGRSWGPLNTVFNFIASPFEKAFTGIGSYVEEKNQRNNDLEALRAENDALREQMKQMEYEQTKTSLQLQKMQELMDLYEIDNYYSEYPKTGAQIISYASNNWVDSVTIDKGNADGLTRYMPVLAGGGLYGHVETVYQQYSMVTSILSEDSSVSCEVFRSGAHVMLEGDVVQKAKGLCKIEFMLDQTDIAIGDEIVTSFYSTIYPPGIRVGEVTKVEEKGDGISGVAYVKPFADIADDSYVLVMTDAVVKSVEEGVS